MTRLRDFKGDEMQYIGIDIGGTKCAVVSGNEEKILNKIRFDTTDKEETILNILNAVEKLGVLASTVK